MILMILGMQLMVSCSMLSGFPEVWILSNSAATNGLPVSGYTTASAYFMWERILRIPMVFPNGLQQNPQLKFTLVIPDGLN